MMESDLLVNVLVAGSLVISESSDNNSPHSESVK